MSSKKEVVKNNPKSQSNKSTNDNAQSTNAQSTNDNAKTKQAGNNGKKTKTSKFDINWIPETVSAYFKHIGVASKTYNND